MENLERESNSHYKNREAEEAHVRRSVWGYEPGTESGTGSEAENVSDKMRDTVLGDVIHPTPIIMPPQERSSAAWPIVAGLALASLLPTAAIAGVAGYLLSRPAEQIEAPEFDDESVSVGLGRIVDTLQLTPVDQ
jgi:hypothetical protein